MTVKTPVYSTLAKCEILSTGESARSFNMSGINRWSKSTEVKEKEDILNAAANSENAFFDRNFNS